MGKKPLYLVLGPEMRREVVYMAYPIPDKWLIDKVEVFVCVCVDSSEKSEYDMLVSSFMVSSLNMVFVKEEPMLLH